MKPYLVVLIIFQSFYGSSQTAVLVCSLSDSLAESSGLINLNGRLITHNDSGGEAILYEIDTTSGMISRQVSLVNALNVDWESLCYDNDYIYVGDFGNNLGDRTNLKIYRLSINDYINTINDTVLVDTIRFNYEDQTSFIPMQYATNFDAEAFLPIGDSLYIFTKNWGNDWTNIYSVPKIPGTYQANRVDSIQIQGLITGATLQTSTHSMALLGHVLTPFFVDISSSDLPTFSDLTVITTNFNVPASFQVEGLTNAGTNSYYITAEDHLTGTASLYRFTPSYLGVNESFQNHKAKFYPNPCQGVLFFDSSIYASLELYDQKERLIYKVSVSPLNVESLASGIYFAKLIDANGDVISKDKLIIE